MKVIFRQIYQLKRFNSRYVHNLAPCRQALKHPQTTEIVHAQNLMTEAAQMLEQGKIDHAMEAYQRSNELYPSAEALYNMGNIEFQMGRIQEARHHWLESIKVDANHADVYVNLGNLELGFGKNPESAIDLYMKALELSPEDGEIRFNLAVAHDKSNQLLLAIEQYELARKHLQSLISPSNPEDEDINSEAVDILKLRLEQLEGMLRNAKARHIAASLKSPQTTP